MIPPQPFSLRIFVAEGDPDGLRLVDRSNWIGRAVIFPRPLFPKIKHREEFKQAGVYLLMGPRTDGDGEALYIGEGDPVRPRLEKHYAEKDFWTQAVFFVAGPGQLNKAHVQYLESQLVSRAKAAKRTPLENGNLPAEPTLSEADRADMDVFLQNILGMLPVLGVYAFEQPNPNGARIPKPLLTCQSKGVVATGYDTAQGFIVRQGSQAVLEETQSLHDHFPGVVDRRQGLIKSGVLVSKGLHLQFAQDYTFTSPSLASAVVLGRASNGRTDWKDASGRTLREIQELESTS